MSFIKTSALASACLLASVAFATADEIRLTDETLDTVTAGAITALPPIQPIQGNLGGFDGSPSLFGPLNPEPVVVPDPVPDPTPTPVAPTLGGIGGAFANVEQLLQQLLAIANR